MDLITAVVRDCTGRPPEKVIGTGTLLDTARLRARLAEIAKKIPEDILNKYQQKRKENIFPIIAPLNGNMCICGMDFPLAL